MIRLICRTSKHHGDPECLIADHGTQFRKWFHDKLTYTGIHHVRSRVRTPYLNGKMERAFRTFKLWWRYLVTGLSTRGIQRQLDNYRAWYNTHRPHSALKGLTPQETWDKLSLPEPSAFRAADPVKAWINIQRQRYRDDPGLPVIQISVRKAA